MRPMVITIDGPSAAGKSSTARRLAERLGFEFLDTGALYRALAIAADECGLGSTASEEAIIELLTATHIVFDHGRVWLNARELHDEELRSPDTSQFASILAQSHAVREYLSRLQREYAKGRSLVTEGRDQGTVVFPDADCKFYLTAELEERARRRLTDRSAGLPVPSFEHVVNELRLRDERDAQRPLHPLRAAEDAITVDSTAKPLERVLDELEACVRRRFAEQAGG